MIPCPFCEIDPARIVAESTTAIAIRDEFPVAEGHTLIVPRRHVSSIFALSSEQQAAIWAFMTDVREQLRIQFLPDAFTIGINDGAAAGQTIEHAHIHLIPRRIGDVPDPRGGVRHIIPGNARYWEK
jgi:diadenosine tetraphosphate (Ap4A) HIT family hydrolase